MKKTHFKKLRNPDYLGSWDLCDNNGKMTDIILTVKEVVKQKVFDGKGGSEDLPVMSFAENVKPMVMNSTNLKSMAKVTGSNFIEDWKDVKVQITVKSIKAFGEFHDALRIVQKTITTKKLPELPESGENFNKVVKAMQSGYTIEQIRKKWSISESVENLLNLAKNETV